MKSIGHYTGWVIPAALLLILALTGGVSWGATPQVAAGSSHTIFLHSDGTLWGAGQNAFGQLGDGTFTDHSAPARIGTASNWTAVAAGQEHNLALRADGTLWAWGLNDFGELGVTNSAGVPVASQGSPVQVGTAHDWVAVAAAGGASSFALKADGTLWAWGDNTLGQLGNGNPSGAQVNTPAQVLNPSGIAFTAVASGGGHALALQADGSLWSWGSNSNGELGQGNTLPQTPPATPTQVIVATAVSDNDWSAIAAGDSHALALKADGTLWSWGSNSNGQLGQPALGAGTGVNQSTPAPVGTDRNWSAISAGSLNSLALKRNGTLWGFGDNGRGELGAGQNALLSISPVQSSPNGTDFVALSAGAFHGMALKSNGAIFAFGDNSSGQFGSGTTVSSTSLVPATSDSGGWIASEPGAQYTVARRSNGTLWSWGDNFFGQLGDGTTNPSLVPIPVGVAANWSGHSAGLSHVVALRSDGSLWSWGDNSFGQLGNGSVNPSLVPARITSTNDWAAVAAGDSHTLALKADGTLWAWGDNTFGQLGVGSNLQGNQPQQVLTPGSTGNFDSNWVAISAGGSHSLGLQADGSLWVWGDNSLGQLGASFVAATTSPQQLTNTTLSLLHPGFDSSWKAISAGLGHTLGLQANGTLWAWGDNADGQLGNGDTLLAGQPTPVQVLNILAAPYVAIAAADAHSTALRSDGTLWSFGSDLNGQLGNGASPAPPATPVQEAGLASDWAYLSAAGSHTVALKAAGTLWNWGDNFSGQLGDGTTTNRPAPVALLEAFATIAPNLDFGALAVGGSAVSRPLNITNPGNSALSVILSATTGADAGLFAASLGACGSIPAQGSCQLQVTFTPNAAAGAKSASLPITLNDPLQPQLQVSLTAQLAQLLTVTTSVTPVGAGTITGPSQVVPGSSPTYSIAANTGFHITDVQLGGVSQGPATSLTLASLSAGTSIAASFALNPHTVTLTQGAGGVIAGPTAVLQNDTPSYTITANPNFRVADVTVNGVSQGAVTALTLPPITGDVTIAASFVVTNFTVTLNAGLHGSITGPTSVLVGTRPSYSIVPDPGCFITGVSVNGVSVGVVSTLTLPTVNADVTIAATFDITTFSVGVTGDAKGSISPAGSTLIPFGGNQTFSFTPNTGYHVVSVVADGVAQLPPPASFTFSNVTASGHTLKVTFIPDGDLNGDGLVTVGDALRALQIAVQLITATPQDLLHADVAPFDALGVPVPDGQVTIGDALGILRKAVGLTTAF